MNFEEKIKGFEYNLKTCAEDLINLKAGLAAASRFTATFLQECQSEGIERVGVGRLPKGKKWPFGSSDSVFTFADERDRNGWPAIWGVVQRLNISRGCGNTNQHQADLSKLIDGIYELRDGNWRKID